jgi:hypothetical protein
MSLRDGVAPTQEEEGRSAGRGYRVSCLSPHRRATARVESSETEAWQVARGSRAARTRIAGGTSTPSAWEVSL